MKPETNMITSNATKRPLTVTEIRELIRFLTRKQDEVNGGYKLLMQGARRRDYEAAQGNPERLARYTNTLGGGPEQDKAEAQFYDRLMRISTLKVALEVAAGIQPVSAIKIENL